MTLRFRAANPMSLAMLRFFASLLAVLALALMPMAMAGGMVHAAGAPMEATDGHCAGTDLPKNERKSGIATGCMGACTGLPAAQLEPGDVADLPPVEVTTASPRPLTGVLADRETPPPRSVPAI